MHQQKPVEAIFEQSNLTRSQFLIWTGQKLNPDLPLYNMAMAYRLRGPLHIAEFTKAFETVVAASDGMRLTVVEQDGIPQNHFADSLTERLLHIDFSDRANPQEHLENWIDERRTFRFKLDARGMFAQRTISMVTPGSLRRVTAWEINWTA